MNDPRAVIQAVDGAADLRGMIITLLRAYREEQRQRRRRVMTMLQLAAPEGRPIGDAGLDRSALTAPAFPEEQTGGMR